MKVCLLTHSYPRFRGDWRSNFLHSLACAYARQGAEVTVLVPLSAEWDGGPGDDADITIKTFRYLPFRSWHRFGYGRAMKGDLHFSLSALLAIPLVMFFGILALGRLWRKNRFDLVQAHWAVPNTLIAVVARRLFACRGKVFTSFPGSDVTALVKLGCIGRLFGRIIARSDFLSCNSSDLREDLDRYCNIPEQRIDSVIYGVNPGIITAASAQRRAVRRRLGVGPDEIVLLMIGRFVKKKGFETALQAMPEIVRQYPQVKLVIVGDGPLVDEYQSIIKKFKLGAMVLLPGQVPLDALPGYYAAADLFLMPSRRQPSDGLNTVVPEAMAAGLAIVASRVGGNDLVVTHEYNGLLHEPEDPRGLSRAVIGLLGSPKTMKLYGRRSASLAKTRFSWDAIACYNLERYKNMTGMDCGAPD